jgi:hypothetical protein
MKGGYQLQYNIECFSGSGFSPNNVPDSIATLRSASTSFTLPGVWVLQNRDRGSVKVATTYNDIKNVDYCSIGDMYYWVTGITMHNENMAELMLEPDYLTSIGIGNLNITSGWCTRRHVQSDGLFDNVLDEAFSPTEPLKVDVDSSNTLTPGSDRTSLHVVMATVDLSNPDISTAARTFTDSTTALTVTVPIIPPARYSTRYALEITSDNSTYSNSKIPSTMAFNGDNAVVKTNIQAVRSLGIEQAITGAYNIPMCYVDAVVDDVPGVSYAGFVSVVKDVETNLNPEYQSGIKNKKAFSGQFQRVCLASTASASQAEYEAHDIWESGNFKFRLFADLMPTGRPYCKPSVYHGNTSNLFLGAVEGGVWQNQPLAFSQPSGSAIDMANTRREIETGTVTSSGGVVTNIVGGVASGLAGNVAGAVSGGVGAVTGFANGVYNMADQVFQHNVRNIVVAPNVVFPLTPGLQNYLGNFFFAYRYRLSENDTIKFDNYLTQFGYATNEPLTDSCFTGRVNFNYVKAEGINIDSPHPLTMRLGAIKQLTDGVRVWHTAPTIGAMYNNPIV